jgi:heme/copper-type cytochrome/quinol oxidase subunit 1
MVYFSLALMLGILITVRAPAGMFPVYIHLLVFGWLTQLIFGVIYWMFPKYSRQTPRGHESLAWITYGALNLGLVLRAIAEPLHAAQVSQLSGWLLVLSAILQWLSGLTFVANTWPRIKEK